MHPNHNRVLGRRLRNMKKRAFILFAMTAVLLIFSLFGSACAAEAGKEPAARTILLWADGARMENSTICRSSGLPQQGKESGQN